MNWKVIEDNRERFCADEKEIKLLKLKWTRVDLENSKQHANYVVNLLLLARRLFGNKRLLQAQIGDVIGLYEKRVCNVMSKARKISLEQYNMAIHNERFYGYRIGDAQDAVDEIGKSIVSEMAHGKTMNRLIKYGDYDFSKETLGEERYILLRHAKLYNKTCTSWREGMEEIFSEEWEKIKKLRDHYKSQRDVLGDV